MQISNETRSKLDRATFTITSGGAFRFVNDGHSPPFDGGYRVVDRPAKLDNLVAYMQTEPN